MKGLDAYLLAIIGTVLIAAILTAVVPEGKTSGIVKGVAKLACLLSIVSPIPQFFQSLGEEENFSQSVIQTDESFIKYYSELRIQNAEDTLEEVLLKEYSMKTDVSLSWEFTKEETEYHTREIRITKISVKTENQLSEEDKNAMWEYLRKNYCSEVMIE